MIKRKITSCTQENTDHEKSYAKTRRKHLNPTQQHKVVSIPSAAQLQNLYGCFSFAYLYRPKVDHKQSLFSFQLAAPEAETMCLSYYEHHLLQSCQSKYRLVQL